MYSAHDLLPYNFKASFAIFYNDSVDPGGRPYFNLTNSTISVDDTAECGD